MKNANQPANGALELSTEGQPAKPTLAERLKDPKRWRKSITDVGVWFLFGTLLTTMLSMYSPGYPIVVGTASIKPGVYWLDQTAYSYSVDDFVTFAFKPTQPWLLERYGTDRVFTKMVKGVAGATIYADANHKLKVCHSTVYSGGEPRCEELGQLQRADSLGRPMTPWIPANHQYTLKDDELWVHGPNPKSLDSRYYGPIRTSAVSGKAKPLFYWE